MRKSIFTNIISKILLIAMVLVILFNEVNVDAAIKVIKKNDKVYVTGTVNVRSNYTSNSKKLGVLKRGNTVKRIGVVSNGWTKIVYKSKNAYVSSKYISVKKTTNKTATTNNSTTTNKATPTPLPANMIDPKHFASNNSRLESTKNIDRNSIITYRDQLNYLNRHSIQESDNLVWSDECEKIAMQYICGDIPWTSQYGIIEISSITEKVPTEQVMDSIYNSLMSDYSDKREIGIACITFSSPGGTRCHRVACIVKLS
jgi:SH3 domain protein